MPKLYTLSPQPSLRAQSPKSKRMSDALSLAFCTPRHLRTFVYHLFDS